MRARGQSVFAVLVLVVVVGAASLAGRAGTRAVPGAAGGSAPSQAWICPHGGGEDWRGRIVVANPSDQASTVRVTGLGSGSPSRPQVVELPAGTTATVDVEPTARGDATFVEAFGGWVAAGWILRGAPGDASAGAEPCAAAGGRSWFLPEGDAGEGSRTFLILTNPYAADAVVDIALFSPDQPPIRDSELTDMVIPARRSRAIPVGGFAKGEHAFGIQVAVTVGRVAAASLVVSTLSGIQSVLGSPALGTGALLPTRAGAGQTELLVLAPGDGAIGLGATLLSSAAPGPAGDLIDSSQDGISEHAYPIPLAGPSSIDVSVADGTAAIALRTHGPGGDDAATAGAAAPVTDWIVLPPGTGGAARPRLLLVNPGDTDAEVQVTFLGPSDAADLPGPITLTIPAGRVGGPDRGALEAFSSAAVLVHSSVPVVALGASTASGRRRTSSFSLSAGIPIP